MALPTVTRFKIMHASLQFSDPQRRRRADLEALYHHGMTKGIHAICHTEAADQGPDIAEIGAANGYQVHHPQIDEAGKVAATAILVHPDLDILTAQYVPVIPAGPGHGPRGVTSLQVGFDGEVIAVSTWHALRGWDYETADRRRDIIDQWQAALTIATAYGRGTDLTVMTADTNYDEDDKSRNRPSRMLRDAGWTSALDEMGNEEGTHGRRRIDEIWTLDADRRVSVRRVNVLTDEELHLGTDHLPVVAVLEILPRGFNLKNR